MVPNRTNIPGLLCSGSFASLPQRQIASKLNVLECQTCLYIFYISNPSMWPFTLSRFSSGSYSRCLVGGISSWVVSLKPFNAHFEGCLNRTWNNNNNRFKKIYIYTSKWLCSCLRWILPACKILDENKKNTKHRQINCHRVIERRGDSWHTKNVQASRCAKSFLSRIF